MCKCNGKISTRVSNTNEISSEELWHCSFRSAAGSYFINIHTKTHCVYLDDTQYSYHEDCHRTVFLGNCYYKNEIDRFQNANSQYFSICYIAEMSYKRVAVRMLLALILHFKHRITNMIHILSQFPSAAWANSMNKKVLVQLNVFDWWYT